MHNPASSAAFTAVFWKILSGSWCSALERLVANNNYLALIYFVVWFFFFCHFEVGY